MRPLRSTLSLLAFGLLLAVSAPAHAGNITGRVFTAENPDSLAKGAGVTLIFRGADGEMIRKKLETDTDGHFHFLDLAQDTSIAYVLQIFYRGRDFLSEPIHFTPGQDEVDYSVLLSDRARSEGDLPSGHPPLTGQPPQGIAVRPNPLHTVLIVLWIVLIFALLAFLGRPRAGDAKAAEPPAGVRALIRDIASLDNRHADGVIGEEEYRKVREGLVARLRTLTQRASG
jgi:hypothetical protein